MQTAQTHKDIALLNEGHWYVAWVHFEIAENYFVDEFFYIDFLDFLSYIQKSFHISSLSKTAFLLQLFIPARDKAYHNSSEIDTQCQKERLLKSLLPTSTLSLKILFRMIVRLAMPCYPRGLALKIKAQRLFPTDKFMGVFSGSRQVNALRGVCASNGVKRVVCRQRWEVFGCCIEEGAFWGYYFILFDYYKVVYGCIEWPWLCVNLLLAYFWGRSKVMCEKGVFWNIMMVWKGWSAEEERWIMGI